MSKLRLAVRDMSAAYLRTDSEDRTLTELRVWQQQMERRTHALRVARLGRAARIGAEGRGR